MTVIFAFLILAGLGVFWGIGLAIADKKLAVEKNPKLVQLEGMMPNANCGGCGFTGCSAYAEAVFNGEAKPGLCSVGGQKLSDSMCTVLGLDAISVSEKKVAFVFCKGNCNKTKKDYDYHGLDDCNAADLLFKGDSSCKFGCLHLGSCIKVCQYGAISKNRGGEIIVDSEICVGCGKCQSVCPKGVIRLIPASSKYQVACNSKEKGADVRKVCEAGCIGCKICEVKFPDSGFSVNENLSRYNSDVYSEDTDRAYEACPRKIIIKREI